MFCIPGLSICSPKHDTLRLSSLLPEISNKDQIQSGVYLLQGTEIISGMTIFVIYQEINHVEQCTVYDTTVFVMYRGDLLIQFFWMTSLDSL